MKRKTAKNPQAIWMAKRRAHALGPKRCREIAAMGGRAKAEKARLAKAMAKEGADEVTPDKRPVARRRVRHL